MDQQLITASSEDMAPSCGLHYFQEQMVQTIHHFYISGDIGAPQAYIEMIHTIRSASPNDIIHLHLNTTGGQLDTGIQLINAMKESSAHIICSLEAQAFSLGSMIFLSADDFIVHDSALLMIHDFNGGVAGKGNEQRMRLEAITHVYDSFVRPIYTPFLSDKEVDSVISGKDMWLHAPEIKSRLEKMIQDAEKPKKTPRKKRTSTK